MVAYFARLLIKGVTTTLLLLIVLHSFLSYAPGGATDTVQELRRSGDPIWPYWGLPSGLITVLELERPWPFSALAWLFEPTETEYYSVVNGTVSTGININIAGVPIRGSGVLTGDFGESLIYQPGVPVLDIISRWLDKYFLAHLAVLFVAMVIACVQRRGRPKLQELPIRLLPSLLATRNATQAGAMYGLLAAWPLSRGNLVT